MRGVVGTGWQACLDEDGGEEEEDDEDEDDHKACVCARPTDDSIYQA